MRLPGIEKKWFKSIVFFLILLSTLIAIGIKNWPSNLETYYSKEILDRNGVLFHCFLSKDDKWRLQIENQLLPKKLVNTILWKEDKYFFYHPGFNPFSIFKSGVANIISGRRLTGASTITMQAVKLQTRGKRSWFNKIKETFLAILWEIKFSKEEILEYYLSHLPFGGNIEGFRSASHIYYGKSLEKLTLAQYVALSLIPNRPNKLNPAKNPELLREKRNQFLKKLFLAKQITEEEYKDAILEPIFIQSNPLPTRVHHIANKFKNSSANRIQTSLDLKIQDQLEVLFMNESRRWKRQGIHNSALLVAEITSGQIVTYIGNQDFFDNENAGQVDGIEAIRSPGSTLKPFIYQKAFERGLITPKTVLYDIPQDYSSYIPENYDQKFRGKVFADNALVQSLNIPAIDLLQKITIDTLMAQLGKMGMKNLIQKTKEPGLALALGGCGTNLFELVQAYNCLADHGRFKPLSYLKPAFPQKNFLALDPPTSEMVKNILCLNNRNEALISMAGNKENFKTTAWKTGTSFGLKDAWCIGFGKKYVLGVWFGNFSGEGNSNISGLEVAAPVFQKLIENLERNTPNFQDKTVSKWKKRWVCKETGLKLANSCKDSLEDYFLPLVSNSTPCDHQKELEVSNNCQISYCQNCKPKTGTKTIWVDNLKPAYRAYLASKEIKTWSPVHNPKCKSVTGGNVFNFKTPVEGRTYFLNGKPEIRIEVQMNTNSEAFPVEFYSQGKKLNTSKAGESIFINLKEGKHILHAIDNLGNQTEVSFLIKHF
jgi:penicillin-binding protein 1C